METNILITGLLFVLFFMSLVVMFFFIVEWGKKQKAKDDKLEAEYMKLYNEIITETQWRAVSDHNRDVIRHKLKRLCELEYRNKEKTTVAYTEFMRKFYAVDGVDEHSPEAIFSEFNDN
jgi:hypothetical protein